MIKSRFYCELRVKLGIIKISIFLFLFLLVFPESSITYKNNPPYFTNLPASFTIHAGRNYSFQVKSTDPEGDWLTYTMRNAPPYMLINNDTGLITWENPLMGVYYISVAVADRSNAAVIETLSLIVKVPPIINNLPAFAVGSVRVPFTFKVDAFSKEVNALNYSLIKGTPPGMSINKDTGLISWEKPILGSYQITVGIFDGVNNVESLLFLRVLDPTITPKITNFTQIINNINVSVVKIPVGSNLIPRMVLAKDIIKGREEFKSIVERTKAVAAINGAFFNAYNTPPDPNEPKGVIIKDRKLIHVGSRQTTIGFTYDGKIKMDRLSFTIKGGINGATYWLNHWFVNSMNHTPSNLNSPGLYLYTPEWGNSVGYTTGTSVVISKGFVTNIVKNQDVDIPKDGYVLRIINQYLDEIKFNVGDSVEYSVVLKSNDLTNLQWDDVVTAVGAGPRLVVNGKVEVGTNEEGFTEEKIRTLSGTRSAIGYTLGGDILLVSVPSATINQLAQIMKELGAYNAMNLDGGASSALYANGTYLRTPGRALNNVLVFSPPIIPVLLLFTVDATTYLINGFSYVMDIAPVVIEGRTLLPIRYVVEPMGANIKWEDATKKVTITLYSTTIELWIGKSSAKVNGKDTPIDSTNNKVVPILKDGRTLLPLRFVSENLGADVLWDGILKTVTVKYTK